MDILLDTHAFIWFINGDKQLSKKSIEIITDIKNDCYLSIASIWEIAIKMSLNRLKIKGGLSNINEFLTGNNIKLLPITFEHIQTLLGLPFHHRDPFDRIIIAQSIKENLTIVTKDDSIKRYKIKIFW